VISVIVLCVDRPAMLQRCVQTVLATVDQEQTPIEWVFVLNGATPEIAAYVETVEGRVVVARLPENLGVTPGRNLGMKMATGELLLFLDDDAYAEKQGWLSEMTKYFADEHVGVVGESGSYVEPTTPGIFWECKTPGAECDVVQGYCFLFRRRLIDEIGYLDPVYGKFWHEESDYALQAKRAGWKVINAGWVGVTHYGSGSGDDGTYGRKIEYLFQKFRRHFPTILVPKEARR